ncbi:MAG: nitroreductase family protein [Deltaproteobacteria bacterium]|nr:nitroreductase family protein [Deltaproteobacteria bacterium]
MGIVKGRRSIRRFQDKPIPEKDLQQILKSSRTLSPLPIPPSSASPRRPWCSRSAGSCRAPVIIRDR